MKKTIIILTTFLGLGIVGIISAATIQNNINQKERYNAKDSNVNFYNENTNSTCYCTSCENQPLSKKLEKEYDCIACTRCGQTGKIACKGWDGQREKLGHWEHCPDCSNCNNNDGCGIGWVKTLVHQYYIYYCPKCKREYSGC